MVAISLTPTKGNAGARWFPHSGHLGLTPVKLEGIVRTRLEEDGKATSASALTVALRCYEARMGRVGAIKTNILAEQSVTLWSPPSGAQFAPLGELEVPFRIVLPAKAAGNSTFHLQDYRVYWRIEATIHMPHIVGIGTRQAKCFDVNLVRYNKPSPVLRPPAPTSQPVALGLPKQPVGPLDPIPVSLCIHAPGTVERVTFALERRIDFVECSPASSVTQLSTSSLDSTLACSSTAALVPLCESLACQRSSSPAYAKPAQVVLATTEVVPPSSLAARLQVPVPKSGAHWGIGETMQGGLARVRFFVTARVQLSVGGAELIESCQEEIVVIAVDDAERLRVHSKYSMKRPATSPSSIENREEPKRPAHLPSPPPSPEHLAVPRPGKPSKRPHTSSGTCEQRRALPLRPRSRGNAVVEPEQLRAWECEPAPPTPPPRSRSALRLFSKKRRSPSPDLSIGVARPVVVPSIRTAEVLEWEAEVERFSSASAREAVLNGTRTRLSV